MRTAKAISLAWAGWLCASLAIGAPWSCERVELEAMVGPEDVALDPSVTPASRLLISSMDRRRGHEGCDGAIFVLDLDSVRVSHCAAHSTISAGHQTELSWWRSTII
jgi:hypothetical protein